MHEQNWILTDQITEKEMFALLTLCEAAGYHVHPTTWDISDLVKFPYLGNQVSGIGVDRWSSYGWVGQGYLKFNIYSEAEKWLKKKIEIQCRKEST